MILRWLKRFFCALFCGLFGGALGWGFALGIDYVFSHWHDPNNYIFAIPFLLVPDLVRSILHIPDEQRISNEFYNFSYAFVVFLVFIFLAIAIQALLVLIRPKRKA